jgi:hypothetical protein
MITVGPCELFVKIDAHQIIPDRSVADGVNWLQHRVIVNSQFNKRDETLRGREHRFTLLYSKLLEKTLGTRLYSRVIPAAVDAGIIERSFYTEGKSYGYRIGDRYTGNKIKIVVPVDKRLRRRILKERKPKGEHRLRDKTYRALFAWLGKVEIDMGDLALIQAEAYARHLAKGGGLSRAEFDDYVHAQLLALQRGHYQFSVSDLGRVYSNVATLVRPARKRLRIDGQPLIEIDLVNSQVLFLTVLLLKQFTPRPTSVVRDAIVDYDVINTCLADTSTGMENISLTSSLTSPFLPPRSPQQTPAVLTDIKEKDICSSFSWLDKSDVKSGTGSGNPDSLIPSDVRQWVGLVESGDLYTHLMSLMGWGESRRGEFKDNELFSVMYGNPLNFGWRKSRDRLLSPSVLKPILANHFPTVYAFLVHQHNKHGLGGLARAMQRAESDLMIKRVCGVMTEKFPAAPLLTVHDSILTTAPWTGKVERYIIEEFATLGIHLALRESPEPTNIEEF